MLTNSSLPPILDAIFSGKVLTALSNSTTVNASTSVTVTGDTTNIPAAGYVSGAGVPDGTTYTISGTTVTLSTGATASASGVPLTFSLLPRTLYFAIFTSNPTTSGGGTECSYSGYARVSQDANLTNFPATASQNKKNANTIAFPAVTGSSISITGWGAYDAATGGNLWYFGTLASSTNMNVTDIPQWAPTVFDVTF